MGEAATNEFSINGKRHSYSHVYVNTNETARGHVVGHVNGNDNRVTMDVVSNGVRGFETTFLEMDDATAFGMKKKLKTIFASASP